MRIRFLAAILFMPTGAMMASAASDPVSVPAKYDGRYAIKVVTASGACPAALDVQIQVARGEATVQASTLFTVSGGISDTGVVRGTIATAPATALVVGRIGQDGVGRGTWRTRDGSLLSCAGSWTAHRA